MENVQTVGGDLERKEKDTLLTYEKTSDGKAKLRWVLTIVIGLIAAAITVALIIGGGWLIGAALAALKVGSIASILTASFIGGAILVGTVGGSFVRI